MIARALFASALLLVAQMPVSAQDSGCLGCHAGIEDFTDGPMMQAIQAIGGGHGDSAGCVVCHGGDPAAKDKEAA